MNKSDLVKSFEALTDKIISIDLNKDSDEIIKEVTHLISERNVVIEQMNVADGEIDNRTLNRLIQKNQQIEVELGEIILSIKDDIEHIINEKALSSVKKKAHRGYMNLGAQNDGYFIDKKK